MELVVAESMEEALIKGRDPSTKKGGMKVGEMVWWHGMGFLVTDVRPNGNFGFRNPYYRVTMSTDWAEWDWRLGIWMMKGGHGLKPRRMNGKLIEPDLPRCENCNAITHRKMFCTDCCNEGAARDYNNNK